MVASFKLETDLLQNQSCPLCFTIVSVGLGAREQKGIHMSVCVCVHECVSVSGITMSALPSVCLHAHPSVNLHMRTHFFFFVIDEHFCSGASVRAHVSVRSAVYARNGSALFFFPGTAAIGLD